ncbi:probable prolyl 4-hydroxylase 12 [Impatiens glandulifera]|uniref:probable prolyl 4-hydroxylase 12 n=1 Tax=Impatiens glandulifera TaxID=253017 RepID=UPI001FB05FD1|nr:probable prolyl 4-hydroxylase 12 [Impatiens glandulifera]
MKNSAKHGETPESTNVNTEDDISASIEERVLAWTFLPKENSEPFNVMHLGIEDANQKYDYFSKKSTDEPLVATVVIYLSNVSHGGQIIFPDSRLKNSVTKQNTWSDCSKINTALRPVKGNAILFFNVRPNASPDKSSVHIRCPVLEGEIWYATKLFHVKPITLLQSKVDNSDCSDEDDNCPQWAAVGECKKNPVFMVGSPDYYGTCRKSCTVC